MNNDPFSELSNVARAYVGLDKVMFGMYRDKDHGCYRIATSLITRANLPALIRARCYMILSTRRTPLAVQHAELAVSLIDEDVRALLLPEASPEEQLAMARELLALAQAKAAEDLAKKAALKPSAPPEPVISDADATALDEAVETLPQPPARSTSPGRHGLYSPGVSMTTYARGALADPASPKPSTPQKDNETAMDDEMGMADSWSDESQL